jgi:hypothetical protein
MKHITHIMKNTTKQIKTIKQSTTTQKQQPKKTSKVKTLPKPVKPAFNPKKVGKTKPIASPIIRKPLKSKESERGAVRMPAVTKNEPPADQIQRRLKGKSPWYQSIQFPAQNADVKIPDSNGCDTGTLQCYQQVSVPINANGVAGVRITSPYPNAYANDSDLGSNYQVTDGTLSTSVSPQWGNGTEVGKHIALKTNPTLQSCAQGVRIVSACVMGEIETTSLNDSGEGCAFQTPFDVPPGSTTPYADLVAKFGSSTLPNNKKKSLISRWYPTQMMKRAGESGEQTVSYQDFVDPTLDGGNLVVEWEIGMVFVGLAASAGACKFIICINYEFIPLLNVIDIVSTTPSPVDPQEEALVMNWIAETPSSGVITDKVISTAPQPTKVESNESGFGMFFDVLTELAPYVGGVLSLL